MQLPDSLAKAWILKRVTDASLDWAEEFHVVASQKGLAAAERHSPGFAMVLDLNQDREKKFVLQCLTLAGEPCFRSRHRYGLDPQFVTLWEKLFFDLKQHRQPI